MTINLYTAYVAIDYGITVHLQNEHIYEDEQPLFTGPIRSKPWLRNYPLAARWLTCLAKDQKVASFSPT